LRWSYLLLDGSGETDLLVGKVEDGVVGADEDVTEDVEGSRGGGDVEAHETTDALSDSVVGLLEDVVLGSEGKVDAVDGDVDGGAGLEDVAGGKDTLAVEDVGTEGAVEGVDLLGGSGDEGGSSVSDGLAETLGRAPSERGGSVEEVRDLFVFFFSIPRERERNTQASTKKQRKKV
jgi:hypothetical protein